MNKQGREIETREMRLGDHPFLEALMKAGFDKQFARALLRSFEEQVEKTGEI